MPKGIGFLIGAKVYKKKFKKNLFIKKLFRSIAISK